MKSSVRKRMTAVLFLVAVCMVALVLAPTMVVAAEFTYDKGPNFTVTYPDAWTQDSENPNKVLWRTKEAGSIPIMEINFKDIPAGMTLDKINKKEYKKLVEASQQTVCMITSDKEGKTKDGSPARKTVLSWQYQGWMPLQSSILSTFKDNKWVYVVIHQAPGDPLWDAGHSLTFK